MRPSPDMPWTYRLMRIATLAIAGIPTLSGFFSKDEILASVFARTSHSTLAEASWRGIPGSALLMLVYAMGLAAAARTAIYMTRMMLYTFHGPNRSGAAEQKHLSEAPKRPSALDIEVPASVEDALIKSLAKKADDRFENAREMRCFSCDVLKSPATARINRSAPTCSW